ncbi:fatty acid-binding protein-like [Glandiceps talaboti]
MSQFVGKWKHVRSENLNEILVAQGVPWLLRKIMTSTSPAQDISIADDETWTLKLVLSIKKKENTFKIGEPFEDTDGPFQSTRQYVALLKDGKLVLQRAQNPEEGLVCIREVEEDDMTMTLEFKGVVAKRFFVRV